ncbi:MAG: PLP-dependent transferase, partial [Actinomycetota bacterium]|nr:PLP-dependent transferase [Actinomycetota bacterium]
ETALRVASALAGNDSVASVAYPGLPTDASYELSRKLLGGAGGGTLGFEVAGGRERTKRFQDLLEVITPASSLGGTHSLLVHAASVTHTQLNAEQLHAAQISEGYCRLSVGLEAPNDLMADIDQALARSA